MDDQQLIETFKQKPTDSLRRLLHERGYWVSKNGQIVKPADMDDGWLVNTLKFQFKIVDALRMQALANIGRMCSSSPVPSPELFLQGEYALMSIDPFDPRDDEEYWQWYEPKDIHIPTEEECLADQPIVPHLYAEVKRRKLLDQFTDQQKTLLHVVGGKQRATPR